MSGTGWSRIGPAHDTSRTWNFDAAGHANMEIPTPGNVPGKSVPFNMSHGGDPGSGCTSVTEAGARLHLNWDEPRRHMTFYKAVYRPAVLRANVLTPTAKLSPELKFHLLRHTYASLCVAAGIPPLEIARFMGHAKVTTTVTVYADLFEDDHAVQWTPWARYQSSTQAT